MGALATTDPIDPVGRFAEAANRAIDAGATLDDAIGAERANQILAALSEQDREALLPAAEAIDDALASDDVRLAQARLQTALAEMRLLARVRAARREAPGQDALPAAEQARAHLEQVLARPEFQRVERAALPEQAAEASEAPGWLERLRAWLREALEALFGDDDAGGRDPSSAIQRLLPAELSWLLWAALLVTVLLGIGVAVARALGAPPSISLDTSEEGGTPEEEAAPAPPRYDALARSPDAWLKEADDLAARGELREALRAAYLALLGILDRAGHITYRSEWTNWDTVRTFEGPQAARERFHALTVRFEEAWYGFEPVGRADYRVVREGALDLASMAAPPPRGHGEAPAPDAGAGELA